MAKDPKQYISNLLDAIDYKGNKNEFTDKFLKVCYKQAVVYILQSLESHKRQELEEKIKDIEDSDKVREILLEYVSEKMLISKLEEASQKTTTNYLKKVIPLLTEEQRRKLVG